MAESKHEYQVNVDELFANLPPEQHDWARVGNQLICKTKGHHHMSFLPA